MIYIYKKNKAFTLIEILISMAIFIIIFSITIANFRNSQRSNDFKLQAFDIEDSIRATQNMSLTGTRINGQIPGNGYGINFNLQNNSYTIYGDRSDNEYIGIFDEADSIEASSFVGQHISIEDIFCYSDEQGEYISLSDEENLDILFYSPRGSVVVNNNLDYSQCYIKLIGDNASGFWKISIDVATSRIWSDYILN